MLGCVRPVLSSKSHHYALSDMIQTRCHSAVQTRGYQPASTAPDARQLDFSSSCGAFPRLQAPGEPRAGKIASTNLRFAADAPLEDGEDRLTSLPEELLIHILRYGAPCRRRAARRLVLTQCAVLCWNLLPWCVLCAPARSYAEFAKTTGAGASSPSRKSSCCRHMTRGLATAAASSSWPSLTSIWTYL